MYTCVYAHLRILHFLKFFQKILDKRDLVYYNTDNTNSTVKANKVSYAV